MYKRIVALCLYILVLTVTISSAWILNEATQASFVELDYSGSGKDSGNLSIATKDIEMQVALELNGIWTNYWSSNDKGGSRPVIDEIIPNKIVPFRIKFFNNSSNNVNLKVVISGIKCDQSFTKDDIVYIAAVGGSEFTKYTGVVDTPEYIYKALNTEQPTQQAGSIYTYDFVLYEALEIPPTTEKGYVMIEGYIYFDKDRMGNECAGKTFDITTFRAVP